VLFPARYLFQVVQKAPGFLACVGNFGPIEIITWAGVTAVSAPFGWLVGKSHLK
jgi:hypothetical protein